jgi:hypothetical protein
MVLRETKVGIIGEARIRSDEIRKNIELAVKRQLAHTSPNEDSRALDCIQRFLMAAQTPPVTMDRIIHEAALGIYKTFSFKEVTIGLKSESDGRYRYEEFLGFSKDMETAFRKLSYSLEEFFSQEDYPAIRLSKVTELCIAEENPRLDFEKETYNKETFLARPRHSPEEFVEGDYMDISMYDPEGMLIGWIELSMPMFNKMPSIQTIYRLELFASVLSILIQKTVLEKKC